MLPSKTHQRQLRVSRIPAIPAKAGAYTNAKPLSKLLAQIRLAIQPATIDNTVAVTIIHSFVVSVVQKNATAQATQKSVQACKSELTVWVSPVLTSGERKPRSADEI